MIKRVLWDFKNDTFYQNREQKDSDKEVFFMKGYVTACGYMGYVENEYILFASEDDYFEYVDSLNF